MRLILTNSFWIVGLALLLATFSYHVDQATRHRRSLKQQLEEPSFIRLAWLSMVLVGIGLVATSTALWEGAVWAVLTLLGVLKAVRFWQGQAATRKDIDN